MAVVMLHIISCVLFSGFSVLYKEFPSVIIHSKQIINPYSMSSGHIKGTAHCIKDGYHLPQTLVDGW